MDARKLPGGRVHQGRAQNRRVTIHGCTRVDFRGPLIVGASVANHHHAPTLGQDIQIITEIDVRQHLQNDIRATAVGQC